MIVDIYVKERNGTTKVQVPWLPASIEYIAGEQVVASYDIIAKGPIEIPTGTELATISWESQLPGQNRGKSNPLQRGTWKTPTYYDKIFKRWLKSGTELNVTVTGYPVNLNVVLSSYEATLGGGFGDIEYKISFKEDRDLSITTVKKKTDQTANKTTKKTTKYTVKKGDTIWKIAKKTTGNGNNWKKIYTQNKSIIESTAKKHGKKSSNNGKYLYAGTVLKITITASKKKKYTGTFPTLPSRGYFKSGDKGTQVKNLQKFLNWFGNYKLTVDGIYGSKTTAAVKKFQKAVGITVDGRFGKSSLTKAKAATK